LQAYDAGSGTPSWYFQSQTGIPFASPAVADGTVVVGSSNGSVYGIRA
jgi:outer membrane protein assembly factor BamB